MPDLSSDSAKTSEANTSVVAPSDAETLLASSPLTLHFNRSHLHSTWARTHCLRVPYWFQPHTLHELIHIVNLARTCRAKVLTVGCGHSPSDLTTAQVQGTTTWYVNLDNFRGVVSWDEENHLVTVEAGIRLYQLLAELKQKGWTMPNQGSILDQSIAGAIATGTHGSSLKHGLLSERVVSLTLLLSDGRLATCSKTHNPELYAAALVHIGGLGIITHVTFAAVPQFKLSWEQRIATIPNMLSTWESGLWTEAEFARVWWFPYSDRSIVWKAHRASEEAELTSAPYSWYGTKTGYHVYQFLLYLSSWIPPITPLVERFVFRTQYGWTDGELVGKATQPSDEALLLNCLFSQHVNEWAIPLHHGPEAIRRFQAWITQKPFEQHHIPFNAQGVYVHAPIEVRVSESSKNRVELDTPSGVRALLDHAVIDGPSLYLNATLYRPYYRNFPAMHRYYEAFEFLMKEYNGRPHWAKNFLTLDREQFRAMYGPELTQWDRVRRTVDKVGMFRSGWLERTLLGDEEEEEKTLLSADVEGSQHEEGEWVEVVEDAEEEWGVQSVI